MITDGFPNRICPRETIHFDSKQSFDLRPVNRSFRRAGVLASPVASAHKMFNVVPGGHSAAELHFRAEEPKQSEILRSPPSIRSYGRD